MELTVAQYERLFPPGTKVGTAARWILLRELKRRERTESDPDPAVVDAFERGYREALEDAIDDLAEKRRLRAAIPNSVREET